MAQGDYTDAQKYVMRQLHKAIHGKNMPYRVGVMLLSYPPTDPDYHCRIALATALGKADATSARDLVEIVKALRKLTDQLQAFIDDPSSVGKLPMEMTDEA